MRNRSYDCHRPKTLLSKVKRLEILRVVQGQAPVVSREKAKRLRWSEAASEAGIEFFPFVVDTFVKFGGGEECFGCNCGVSAPVVPIPDRDVTCSLERDLCSGLYGALSCGAGPNSFIVEETSLKVINPRASASQVYRGQGKLGR